jgi:hypothetical protein
VRRAGRRTAAGGKVPFANPRRHRRIRRVDVVAYQDRPRYTADAASADIVADAQTFDDYDTDPDVARQAVTTALQPQLVRLS